MVIRDPDGASASAEAGRSAFVDAVLKDFSSRSQIAVSGEVRRFILTDVLVPDEVWAHELPDRAADLDRAFGILVEALAVAARALDLSERSTLTISDVGTSSGGPFYDVIHNSWNCPFPFVFC